MRKHLLILLLILLPEVSWAVTIRSAGDGNWSAGATWSGGVVPGQTDIVQIRGGDTVTVDTAVLRANRGDTTCRIVNINHNGLLYFDSTVSGNTLAPLQMWGGGCGSSGGAYIDSTYGGRLWIFGGDTLFLWNADQCPTTVDQQDMAMYGADCEIRIEGTSASNRACIQGLYLSNGGEYFPTWWLWSGGTPAPTISIKWARIDNMGDPASSTTSGLQFSQAFSNLTIENSIFDSASIVLAGFQDLTFYRDSFYTYLRSISAIRIVGGNRDTINECFFQVNQCDSFITNTNGPLNFVSCDSVVVKNSRFKGTHLYLASGPKGPITAVSFAGSTYSKMINSRVDSFLTPVNWASWASDSVLYCTLAVNGLDVMDHSGWGAAAKSNVFAGNYIYGTITPDGSDDIFNVYCTQAATGDSLGVRFMFNTIVPKGNSIPLAFRETATLGYRRKGVHIVGNIMAGSGNDLEVNQKDTIIFRHWSSNAFNSRSLGTNAVLDSSAVPANSENISATAFGFVDSTNNDFRLRDDSPMLGALQSAADSTLCAGIFSSPNYNVGAYQGAGVETYQPDLPVGPTNGNTVLRNTTLRPSTGP